MFHKNVNIMHARYSFLSERNIFKFCHHLFNRRDLKTCEFRRSVAILNAVSVMRTCVKELIIKDAKRYGRYCSKFVEALQIDI